MVVTWVDSADPDWRASRDAAASTANVRCQANRYPSTTASSDKELELMLQSAHRFAPWLRRIHVLTARPQVPACLKRPDSAVRLPKCVVVHHDAVLDAAAIPTFNSHAIETALHAIPGLAEAFIYANDDMYATNNIFPGDFFQKGVPILRVLSMINLRYVDPNGYFAAWNNAYKALGLQGRMFITQQAHVWTPLTKTLCLQMWAAHGDKMRAVKMQPFRHAHLEHQYPPVGMAVIMGLEAGTVLRHHPQWGFTSNFQPFNWWPSGVHPHSNTCINEPTPAKLAAVADLLLPGPKRTLEPAVISGPLNTAKNLHFLLLAQKVTWLAPRSDRILRAIASLNMDAGQEIVHWREPKDNESCESSFQLAQQNSKEYVMAVRRLQALK
jgi:hypothetical protein